MKILFYSFCGLCLSAAALDARTQWWEGLSNSERAKQKAERDGQKVGQSCHQPPGDHDYSYLTHSNNTSPAASPTRAPSRTTSETLAQANTKLVTEQAAQQNKEAINRIPDPKNFEKHFKARDAFMEVFKKLPVDTQQTWQKLAASDFGANSMGKLKTEDYMRFKTKLLAAH